MLTESKSRESYKLTLFAEIIDHKKNKKEEEPKKRQNKRGGLNIDGLTDFNPDANVRLSRAGEATTQAAKEKKKKDKKGCC